MVEFFRDLEVQKGLLKVLEEWLGTPFRHHCGVKGFGCDCIHFVARVCEELDILRNVKIPDYPRDWHMHNTKELLKEGIIANLSVKEVSLSCLMNGDIVCSHFGKAASHAGIYFDGHVYQALNGVGVRKISFSDKKFKTKMRFAYRILR